LEGIRSKLYQQIKQSNLKAETAKTFLYHFLKTLEVELDEDWISYKVKIGGKY